MKRPQDAFSVESRKGEVMSDFRRRRFVLPWVAAAMTICLVQPSNAQDLSPRAYLITPYHANAVTIVNSFYNGTINVNGVLPTTDTKGIYNISIVNFYHSFGIFGRSANVVAALPYGTGSFSGELSGVPQHLYRSGLVDSVFRISVNLKGGPAMQPKEFVKWREKVILGVSLKVIAPTGQYDATRLVNWGTNRWSFKPEFGYSQRWHNWVLDGYTGLWFFTPNHDYWSRNVYYPGTRSQTQRPIGSVETHLSYDFKPRLWVSLDGNFWAGGTATIAGVEVPNTVQRSSRIGATAAIPVTKHQSLKFSYSGGTYIQYGGNFQNVSAAWQYSWLGKPK
jgi:Putative MetA-pathway of phenol degradation